MLTCREVSRRASALVDGEIGLRERLTIRLHLLMCVHCRRFTRQLARLVRTLKGRTLSGRVPDGFVERVMTRLDDEASWPLDQPPGEDS